jgi:hypothetical protein
MPLQFQGAKQRDDGRHDLLCAQVHAPKTSRFTDYDRVIESQLNRALHEMERLQATRGSQLSPSSGAVDVVTEVEASVPVDAVQQVVDPEFLDP